MFAQSLVEYGTAAEVGLSVERVFYSAREWVLTAGPEVWLTIGGIVVVTLWLSSHRR